ncbi:MAG: hypothetical protein H0U53_01855 [Actinobacteria bacterium]|nr:hypothetical protein [Actinomycetota bacterium]
MTDVQSPDLTVPTSIAVINAAAACGMFPPDAMPEGDKDKVSEAVKLVELALQAKRVADEVGHSNVPLWPGIEKLLREAGALEGPNGSTPQTQPESVAEQTPVDMSLIQPPDGLDAWPAPPAPVTAPPPAPEPANDDPQAKERWVDASDNYWDVVRYGGGPQIEAINVATGETTILPAGFLKRKATKQPLSPAPPQSDVVVSIPAPPDDLTDAEKGIVEVMPVPAAPQQEQSPVEWAKNLPDPVVESRSAPPQAQEDVSPPPPPSAPAGAPVDDEPLKQRDYVVTFSAPVEDHEGDTEYEALLDTVASDYAPVGMPVPMDLEHPPSGLPEDLTSVSDISARALHSQFNALAARARYLKGLESAKARDCARVRKSYLKEAMRGARKVLGSSASVTEVMQLAEDDPGVALWIEREDRHRDRAEAYGVFLAMYTDNVSVLSREWSMRQKEEDGS